MRIFTSILLACIAAGGCRHAAPAPATGQRVEPDSIVLERGPCFGTCPIYRLSLTRAGGVRFHSRNPGDTARVETGTIAPEAFRALAAEAERIGFDRYPATIMGSAYCGQMATDMPTATVSLFRRGREKRVEDYHGCFGAPRELRQFEDSIDSVAGSRRWVRPSRLN